MYCEKCLNCIKDFRQVHTHLFAFIAVDSKLIIRSSCIEKVIARAISGRLLGSSHECIYIRSKVFTSSLLSRLLQLKSKSAGSAESWYGR